jgi:hypothetical protein
MVNQFLVLGSQFSVLSKTVNQELGSGFGVWYAAQMRRLRWTAGILLLVMLVPAFGPLAMACAARPEAAHCKRQAISTHVVQPEMPCHHAMASPVAPQPESSENLQVASFQAASDDCCSDHCCCGALTSEWARPVSNLLSFVSLLSEPAQRSQHTAPQSVELFGYDSARAPPRS